MQAERRDRFAKLQTLLRVRSVIFLFGFTFGAAVAFAALNLPEGLIDQFLAGDAPKADMSEEFQLPPIELPDNPRIQARLKRYLKSGARLDLLSSYERSGSYLPMITAILEENNLPTHLAFLPILESRFLPQNRSGAGAVGLWQLMPATASELGLKYNRWVDERRDPEKSTLVAVDYLKHLYAKFGNWELALAAYNCGPAQLRRAMRRDKTRDFWKLRRLPKETRNFVPNYYAILHILTKPEQYGVRLPELSKPLDYETIDLETTFSVEQIARLARVAPEVIRRYNPALLGNLAPSGAYAIRIPVGIKEKFLEQYERSPQDEIEVTYITHKVRRGETLSGIASLYGTSVKEIMGDNNLRSSRWIKAGVSLRIATVTVHRAADVATTQSEVAAEDSTADASKLKFVYRVRQKDLNLSRVASYFDVSADAIKGWNPWLQSDRLHAGEEVTIMKSFSDIGMHKTRRGDSLWKLARKYDTTVRDLKRWNQLVSSRIYPGTRLVVSLK